MKTAIIGAGINGLYLAWKLAKRGEDVTVYEKKNRIGKEVCSGLFSDKILDFVPESKNLIQSKIEIVLIRFPKKILKINFSRVFFVINHSELDNLMAELSIRAGAKIILNHTVSDMPEGYDRVIGCDGASSRIRDLLKISPPNFYLGIQGVFENDNPSNTVETWPTKSGFIWKIPKGGKIEYGIMERPQKAKMIFNEFLNKNNIILKEVRSALIPQGLAIPDNKKITLCGDAAGLTKPWSGGGVIWGLLAADILLKNFPDFLRYRRECKKFFLPKIFFSIIIKKLAYFLGFNVARILPKEYKIEGDFLR